MFELYWATAKGGRRLLLAVMTHRCRKSYAQC